MKIFPYKYQRVTDEISVMVPQAFIQTTFGVRNKYQTMNRSNMYVNLGTPGTGFFARESESHHYQDFYHRLVGKSKSNYWKMLMGKEPSFDREIRKVRRMLKGETDPERIKILDSYLACLPIAKNAEECERMILGVKNRMHGPRRTTMSGAIGHLKNKLQLLDRDIQDAQLNLSRDINTARYEHFVEVVKAFIPMASSRRIWDVSTGKRRMVFFDLGVFNFIYSPFDTPLMRDLKGNYYFLFPNGIVRAKSSTHFDIFKWNEVSVLYGEKLDEGIIEMSIPELGLQYRFHHRSAVSAFVDAVNTYKQQEF